MGKEKRLHISSTLSRNKPKRLFLAYSLNEPWVSKSFKFNVSESSK